jgi:glycerophosphoryl diester phosphodiesterase
MAGVSTSGAVLLFGHRGARGEAPENTLPGFAYAYAAGVRAFELDVRLTADERLAVIHDATVDRTTNAAGAVSSFTAAALAQLDARADFPRWPEPCGVPLLDDVLDEYAGKVRFAIEIKSDTPDRLERVATLTAAAIARYQVDEWVAVTSFDPTALDLMRRAAPHMPRVYIGAYDTPVFLETALALGCIQADIPLKRSSIEMVRAAQAAGLRVVGWLGNAPADLAALLEWGVEGITTDQPTMALGFLQARGIAADRWP